MNATEQLADLVRSIPHGKVCSYGRLGECVNPRMIGKHVGGFMRRSNLELPWWRVVGFDGGLPIVKDNAAAAIEQRRRLEQEGVEFDESGKVEMGRFLWHP